MNSPLHLMARKLLTLRIENAEFILMKAKALFRERTETRALAQRKAPNALTAMAEYMALRLLYERKPNRKELQVSVWGSMFSQQLSLFSRSNFTVKTTRLLGVDEKAFPTWEEDIILDTSACVLCKIVYYTVRLHVCIVRAPWTTKGTKSGRHAWLDRSRLALTVKWEGFSLETDQRVFS